MMTDKTMLKAAAFGLAAAEQRGRIFHEHYLRGEGDEKNLRALAADIEACRLNAERLREQLPAEERKSYWWDVPFDIEKPVGKFPGTFAFSEGIYTEQDDFSETIGFRLDKAVRCTTAGDVFRFYLSSSDYVALYADRKALKKNPSSMVDKKIIVYAEEELARKQQVGSYDGPMPFLAENTAAYRHLQSEVRSISRNLSSDLRSFDTRRDNFERVVNGYFDGSPFTDEQLWTMGQKSSDSYYTSSFYRDYRKMEIEQKAREKISRLEYQMAQMRKKAAEARAAYGRYEMKRTLAGVDRGITMRFMRCGYAFYLEQQLAAVVLIQRPETVYSVRHHGTVSPYDIFGEIGGLQELPSAIPDPAPLIDFILEQYGSRIRPYSPLALRPKNASDDLWRYWAEQRFREYLLSL